MIRNVRRGVANADDKVRSFILNTARRSLSRRGSIDYANLTNQTNSRFNSKYTIFQVAGFVGASLIQKHN